MLIDRKEPQLLYQLGPFPLRSDLDLPLPAVSSTDNEMVIIERLTAPPVQGFQRSHVKQFHETTFLLDPARRRIEYFATIDATESLIRELLVENILADFLAGCGELVLHGSAALIGNEATLLIARSGSGKSTLAVALDQSGHPLLCDDFIPISGSTAVWASTRWARIWSDSRDRIGVSPSRRTTAGKSVVGSAAAPTAEPIPLGRLIFLEPREATEPCLAEISRAQAFSVLMESRYLLDPNDDVIIEQHVEKATALLRQVTPVRLLFPHRYELLGRTLQTIARGVVQQCA